MPTESPAMKNRYGHIFCLTRLPVSPWFLAKNRNAVAKRGFIDRSHQTCHIDARCRSGVEGAPKASAA
jgi:hypothetical protein